MPEGAEQNVAKFSAADAKNWYADHILKARRVVAIYGDVDPEDARQLTEKYLGDLPTPQTAEAANVGAAPTTLPTTQAIADAQPMAAPTTAPSDKASIDVLDLKVQKTEQALAGIVIGFKSDSTITDPANATFDVANTLCAGYSYPTGYIFETLRGRGLVYVAAAENSPGRSAKYPGTFLAYAGCDPKNVNTCVDLILLNIARMQGTAQDMQPDWFARSKELIDTGDALENETPDAQAETAALDELFGLGYAWHEKFDDRINAVTLADVQNLCRTRLRQCVVTICTPDPDSVNVALGRRQYDSFPPVDLTPRGVQHGTPGTK
jgi:predicted Zn-dependent peptidase